MHSGTFESMINDFKNGIYDFTKKVNVQVVENVVATYFL